MAIAIILSHGIRVNAQNLLLNSSFEEEEQNNLAAFYADSIFYSRMWYQSTECTVDIIRDTKYCDDTSLKSVDLDAQFCTEVKNGKYCIGFLPLTFLGYMEHITGQLARPLEAGKQYKVSFYLKYTPYKSPFIPKGIGFKFSNDSILFKSKIFFDKKISPFYDQLFSSEKIFADFEVNEYVTDTTWTKYESIYTAKGGEKYLTFGRFSYKNDEKIIKQFKKVRYNPTVKRISKFLRKNKSLVNKNVENVRMELNIKKLEFNSYYLLDEIEVIKQK